MYACRQPRADPVRDRPVDGKRALTAAVHEDHARVVRKLPRAFRGAKIHHLDKAHHHSQLADVYFQQGKLEKAETSYRAALERDSEDIDTRAHLGQCLLRLKRPAEARPLLEGVVAENPKHDYGYSMMALAETLSALGDKEGALNIWKQVTGSHSYPRAKVQLAEIYLERGQKDLARPELHEVLADDVHAPPFQRKRDRVWVRRARKLMRKVE